MHIREHVSRWLDQQSPYALVKPSNPVFIYELRRLKEPPRKGDGKAYRESLLWGFLLLSVAARLFPALSLLGLLLIIPVSILVALVADAYYIIITVGSIGPQIGTGDWDMLRLTPLPSRQILLAKYAAAQLRAWHVMFIDLTLRLGAATLMIIALFSSLMSRTLRQDMFNRTTLFLLLFYGIFGIVYVLEPLWRMRAVVALGLAISARVHNPMAATLNGFAVLLGMRLVQLGLLVLTGYIFAPEGLVVGWDRSVKNVDLSDPLMYLLVFSFGAGAVYAFYKIVEEGALQRALWFAFRME